MEKDKKHLLNAYCFFGSLGILLFAWSLSQYLVLFYEIAFEYSLAIAGVAMIGGGSFFLIRYKSVPLSRPMWLIVGLGLTFFAWSFLYLLLAHHWTH